MDRSQPNTQNLPGFDQMPDIGPAKITAGIAFAVFLDRPEIMGIDSIADHHLAIRGHHCAVPFLAIRV